MSNKECRYAVFTEDYRDSFKNYVKHKKSHDRILDEGCTDFGSYRLPLKTEAALKGTLEKESVFRQIATVYEVRDSGNRLIAKHTGDVASWVTESDGIPIDDAMTDFTTHVIDCHKLGAFFAFTSDFLMDAQFNTEQYIVKRLGKVFGRAENDAFINGNGNEKPTGILNAKGGAEIGVTTSTITYDDVIKLYFSAKPEYRKHGVWLLNDATAVVLRTLKDKNGNYLWNSAHDTILGKPVVYNEYMPSIGAGSKPIAFGDFSFYTIVMREGISIKTLTETLPSLNDVGYLAYEFLDGKLVRPEAIKVLQMSA